MICKEQTTLTAIITIGSTRAKMARRLELDDERAISPWTCLQLFQIAVLIRHPDASIRFDAYCCYAKRSEVYLYLMFRENGPAFVLFN